ncbi:MAG: hypothetical protein ACOH14_08230 [Rhodoglobus sp.]
MSKVGEPTALTKESNSAPTVWPLVVLLSAHGLSLVGNAVTVIVVPLGSLLAGSAVELLGFAPVLLGTGVLYSLVALSPLFGKSWSELDRA